MKQWEREEKKKREKGEWEFAERDGKREKEIQGQEKERRWSERERGLYELKKIIWRNHISSGLLSFRTTQPLPPD